jgi:hypothetical protein
MMGIGNKGKLPSPCGFFVVVFGMVMSQNLVSLLQGMHSTEQVQRVAYTVQYACLKDGLYSHLVD